MEALRQCCKFLLLAMVLAASAAGTAQATPSTQIWIPSTDIQAFKTVHLGFDNYIRTSRNGAVTTNTFDAGLTVGVLPFEKLQMEVGIDYMETGRDTLTDQHPLYFNAKIGTPEESLFVFSPALAAGAYNIGLQESTTNDIGTNQNIFYALAAKTLPVIGRISAGYYNGNPAVLKGGAGTVSDKPANEGVLLSWDRMMSEVSDKLWLGVDYQSGKSAVGALNFGVAWSFSKNVSVIVGYDIYNNTQTGGKNTVTTQVDINFP